MEEKEGSGSLEPEVGSAPSSQQQGPVYGHDASVGKAEGHEGSSMDSHKRRGGEGVLEDDPPGQRHARRNAQEKRPGESRFLDLPDSLHRVVTSFLANHAVYMVVSLCKSLGPLYVSGIKRLSLSALTVAAEATGSEPMDPSLLRFLGRLTCLKGVCVIGSRAVKAFASVAVTASAAQASWAETLQDMDMHAFSISACFKDNERTAVEDQEGHEGLLTLFGLLGKGGWPRLQRLRVGGSQMLFTEGLEVLTQALEGRGGDCERLRALEVSLDASRTTLTARLTDEDLLRRLLASPCCSALEALSFDAGVSLSTACFAQVIAYLRSSSGRGLEALCCRWIPVASEAVPDPAMLVNALADGCLPRLRKLEMSCLLPLGLNGPNAWSALKQWAEGPVSQQLEVFKCRTTTDVFGPLTEGTRAGHGFPVLRSLYLVMATPNEDSVEKLCRSLEAGAMPCLESLILQNMVAGGLARLMGALTRDGTRCSATIKLLSIPHCRADDEEGASIGRALAAGACRGLKKLDLSKVAAVGDRTARSIADALRGGAAKQLEELRLSHTALGDEGCLALKAVMLEFSTSLTDVTFAHSQVTGPIGRFSSMFVRGSARTGGMSRRLVDGEMLEQLVERFGSTSGGTAAEDEGKAPE